MLQDRLRQHRNSPPIVFGPIIEPSGLFKGFGMHLPFELFLQARRACFPGLVLLLVMLALKPGGLMGKTTIKKV